MVVLAVVFGKREADGLSPAQRAGLARVVAAVAGRYAPEDDG